MSKPTRTKAPLRDSERIVGGPDEPNQEYQKKIDRLVKRVDAKERKRKK